MEETSNDSGLLFYVLIHSLQHEVLNGTEFFKATIRTIQLKLIKVAARAKVLKSQY